MHFSIRFLFLFFPRPDFIFLPSSSTALVQFPWHRGRSCGGGRGDADPRGSALHPDAWSEVVFIIDEQSPHSLCCCCFSCTEVSFSHPSVQAAERPLVAQPRCHRCFGPSVPVARFPYKHDSAQVPQCQQKRQGEFKQTTGAGRYFLFLFFFPGRSKKHCHYSFVQIYLI